MRRLTSIIVAVLAGALVTGAVAASGEDERGERGERGGERFQRLPGPPHPPGDLTYSEIHLRRDGNDVVVRVDRGRVRSVNDESITITRNDGEEVTVPIDEETRVFAGPGRQGEPSDLREGQLVMVHREDGQAADFIGLQPRHGDVRMRRAPHPGPPGPGGFELPAPPPPEEG